MQRLCLHTFTVTHSQNNLQGKNTHVAQRSKITFGLTVVFFLFFVQHPVCVLLGSSSVRGTPVVSLKGSVGVWLFFVELHLLEV